MCYPNKLTRKNQSGSKSRINYFQRKGKLLNLKNFLMFQLATLVSMIMIHMIILELPCDVSYKMQD